MKKGLVTRTESSKKKANRSLSRGTKRINGDMLQDYIINNKIDKKAICEKLCVNRGYINDIIRYDRAKIFMFNAICDEMGVNRDFFDYVEESKDPYVEEKDIKEFNLELIHDDLMSLIVYTIKANALMQEMIDMWRND